MFGMRGFFGVLLALGIIAGFAVPASAGSNDCGKGPPAWWNAPRVSYTYSNSSGRSYSSPRHTTYSRSPSYSSRSYSSRGYSSRSYTRSRTVTYSRSTSRSRSSSRYAHSGGYTQWR
jgi:hypothetical protein